MTTQSLNRELVTEIVAGLNTQGKRRELRSTTQSLRTEEEMSWDLNPEAYRAFVRHFDRGKLRKDLTEAEKAEALRIGRIEFKSAGAVRKR